MESTTKVEAKKEVAKVVQSVPPVAVEPVTAKVFGKRVAWLTEDGKLCLTRAQMGVDDFPVLISAVADMILRHVTLGRAVVETAAKTLNRKIGGE